MNTAKAARILGALITGERSFRKKRFGSAWVDRERPYVYHLGGEEIAAMMVARRELARIASLRELKPRKPMSVAELRNALDDPGVRDDDHVIWVELPDHAAAPAIPLIIHRGPPDNILELGS